ncbi:hypothetical protein CARUB_v10003917mg, partial [Capsella rubella]
TQEETEEDIKKHNKQPQHQTREARRSCSRALCCSNNKARLSISSSSSSSSSVESDRSSRFSDQHGSLSSLAHFMVQEKLEQMIRETQEATRQEKIRQEKVRRRRSEGSIGSTKFIVMMAMEKFSYDPREDFRDSMVEMIVANKIKEADELRSLLEYYLSMNPREYRSAILEIFYEVCADLFRS